jgi:hypothetical protein
MGLIDWIRGRNRAQEIPNVSEQTTEKAFIAEARDFADAGRYSDAIELLTSVNRKNKSRDIERELLALRSDGFLAGAWQTEVPEWPSQVDDQFGAEGIPEIGANGINATSIRSGIENHGSLIVRNMITPSQVSLLRDNIDRVLASYDAVEAGSDDPELEGWYEPFGRDPDRDRDTKRSKGAMLTVDSPPALFDLLEVFEACGLSAAIREFFGEPPMLLTRKGTLRLVPHDAATGGWHQDGGFLGEDIRSLNVWIALSDCGMTAPGMDIVGKRLPGIVKTGSNFAQWATNPKAAQEAGEGFTERPVFAAGDAIIFDHLCLHRTAADPGMTDRRYAIETWLMAPSTYKEMGVPILF